MYALRLRQLASAFLDAGSIVPTAKDMAGLMDVLGPDSGLLPAAVQEQTPAGNVQRIGFVSPDGQWQLIISTTRVDVTRRPVGPDGRNMEDVGPFCVRASAWLANVLGYFNRKAHRLAIVQEGLLPVLSSEDMNTLAEILLGPSEAFLGAHPFEWDFRVACAIHRSFGENSEDTNTIVTIKRIGGLLNLPAPEGGLVHKKLDHVRLDLDVNTSLSSSVERFGPPDVQAFFAAAPAWHQELEEKALLRMGFGEGDDEPGQEPAESE